MIISISGLDKKKFSFIKKKFRNITFKEIDDINYNKHLDTSAILIFRESKSKNFIKNFFKKKLFNKYHNLKWMHFSRTGLDEFYPNIKKAFFKITTGKGSSSQQVAEHCLAIILYLTRNLKFINHQSYQKEFNRFKIINKKKILILGYGSIGKEIAKKMRGFDVKIDIVGGKRNKYIKKVFTFNSIFKQIKNYYLVINCLPLTDKTQKIINAKFLNKLSHEGFFLNLSRSSCLNENDLLKYIKKEKFGGIGIDHVNEKLKKRISKISKNKNILITNHTADRLNNLDNRFNLLMKNIKKFVYKKKLTNIYSQKKGY